MTEKAELVQYIYSLIEWAKNKNLSDTAKIFSRDAQDRSGMTEEHWGVIKNPQNWDESKAAEHIKNLLEWTITGMLTTAEVDGNFLNLAVLMKIAELIHQAYEISIGTGEQLEKIINLLRDSSEKVAVNLKSEVETAIDSLSKLRTSV